MNNKISKYTKELKQKFSDKLPVVIVVLVALAFLYSSVKESIAVNIQAGYAIPNSVVNSVVVALDSTFNPNGVIAAALDITQKVQSGEGIIVKDVFKRCKIQSDNRVSDGFFLPYDTKAGINDGVYIGDGSGGQNIRKYLRYDNRSSLDLLASQNVIILSQGTSASTVANAIRQNNEEGLIPIIRLGVADLGDFPFKITNNADEIVDFFKKVGEELMNENKGWKAVISFGPNEPNTGNVGTIMASMGLGGGDYQIMVQRQNQAADQLQQYRVVNGGPFWFAPAIFNGTQTFEAEGREFAYDTYHHLYIDGANNQEKDYDKRKNIDSDLFDAILVNVYSESRKTAYGFYKDYALKEYIDSKPNLVSIVTEFGTIDGGIKIEDLKDDFKELYDDPKIEGINWFRALKDKPSIPPAPTPEQSASLEDYIKYTEQSNKSAKKISLKNFSWVNCTLGTTINKNILTSSNSNSGSISPTSKGGLNEGDNVGGGSGGTMDTAKSLGFTGYSLAIAYSPNDVDATLEYIDIAKSKGFIPIVRLCVQEGNPCGFNLSGGRATDLINFYNAVAARASTNFIGIVGPNEPKTEANVFGGASVEDAKAAAVTAAGSINKNGKMLIAPAAFNLETDELVQYNGVLESGKFDVLIGNAYNHNGQSAAQWATPAINKARSLGLKIIITETGTIEQDGAVDFATSVGELCSKVDGFLMFRSQQASGQGSYPNKPRPYSPDQLKAIASACSGTATANSSSTVAVAETTTTGDSSTAPACTGGIPDENIVLVGDSLTQALSDYNFKGVPDNFEIGEPGASTFWFMPGGQKGNEFSDKVKAAAADSNSKALFLMLGTNDCGGVNVNAFGDNLGKIVDYIKAASHPGLQIYLSTIPNYREGCSSDTLIAYNEKIRSVQSAKGVQLREVGNFSASDTTDGVHLTLGAYTRIANISRELLGASNCPTDDGSSSTGGSEAGTSSGAGSYALSCGVEESHPSEFYQGKNAAALRVKCAGGTCTTKMVGTVEIEAPTKLFSSNSPNGTMRLRYIPVSQVAASQSRTEGYDALNMFAGEIKFGTYSYPLPALGSAINSASQILSETMTSRDINRFSNPSGQSLVKWTQNKLEIQSQQDKTVSVQGEKAVGGYSTNTFSVVEEEDSLNSISERAVTFDGISFNNDAGLADWRKNIMPYDPSIAFPTYIAPKACQKSEMKFINNLDNYITGPELVVEQEKTVTNNSTQQICWMYAGRSIAGRSPAMSGDGVKTCGYVFDTRIFSNANVDTLSPRGGKQMKRIYESYFDASLGRLVQTSRVETGNWTCQELFTGRANPFDGVIEDPEFANDEAPKVLPECDFDDYLLELNKGKLNDPSIRSGRCNIPADLVSCLRYDPQDSDEIYIHTQDYPKASKVKIPNVYSGIYGLYDRLQTIMSQRQMKFVFRENIGMKFKVNTKIRDANESIANIPYDFSTMYDDYFQPELIDNNIPLANNNPTKTQYQYFDDLGYVDILQEYIVAYANEQVQVGDHIMDNPFIEKGIFNPLPERKKIVAGGESNLSLANPVLTCDQVEICKNYTFDELANTFGADTAMKLCPLTKKIPIEETRNCITNIEDERFIDRLNASLCSRGFAVGEDCNFQCNVSDNGNTDDGDDNLGGDPPISGTYPNTACPVADTLHRCFQGPYGSLTHQKSMGLPLDLYPNFTGGSPNAANRDKRVVAPEDGEVLEVINNGGEGSRIVFKGKSGITYYILHLNGNDSSMVRSGSVKGGERIAEMASKSTVPGLYYEDKDIHSHVRAEYNGKDIDPYYLFGQILNCNALKPNSDWPDRKVLTEDIVSNPKDYCVITSGGTFQLNDNGPDKARQSKPQAPDPDTSAMDNGQVKALFDSAYGSPVAFNANQNSSSRSSVTVALASAQTLPQGNAQVLGTSTSPSAFKIRIPVTVNTSILSNYGPRCFERINGGMDCNYHTGVDIAEGVVVGTSVVAAESGRVIKVGNEPNGYGNYVRIVHPNGMSTLYAHNSVVTVSEGDCVRIGQEIAKAGSTGNSDGPHVHMELRKDPNCTIDDYTQNSTQNCAINPSPYMDANKTTSYFTEEELRSTCNGRLPNPDEEEVLQCLPSDDSPDVGSGETYGNVFSLLERVEEITGVDKYYLAGILSLESGPELQNSVGDAIKNGTAVYKGDPMDIGNPNPNSAGAVGPFQFICRTGLSYFYPPGTTNTPCQPWSAGSTGRYYDKVLSCVTALGMSYNSGDILDPKYFGVGACGAATMFGGLEGQSISSYDISNPATRSSANPFWSAAGAYNGGGNYENIPISKWYADSTVGRANFFKKYWDQYKSGDKGSDCKPNAYRDWYYYHVSLGIECISRGSQDGQCRVTTESELNIACQR